jgi:hypothetical protein
MEHLTFLIILLIEDGLTIDEIPFGDFHGSAVPFT